MLGAMIAPKADLDEVDCVADDAVSSAEDVVFSDVVVGTVSFDCGCALVGELTGVGPTIISEVSINKPPPAAAPLLPGDSEDIGDSVVTPSFGFCWLTEVR